MTFTGVTTLKQPDGSTFAPFSLDPEGMVLTEDDELIVTSEGDTALLIAPFVRTFDLQGRSPRTFPIPSVGPIVEPPVTAGQFAVNGLVEVLPLTQHSMLAMERSFSVGAGNTIRIYLVRIGRATDVDRFAALAALLGGIRTVEKTLLLDLDTTGLVLDDVEGMTFGPDLPDGRRSLVLVSDNNFSPAASTQFLAFAHSEG